MLQSMIFLVRRITYRRWSFPSVSKSRHPRGPHFSVTQAELEQVRGCYSNTHIALVVFLRFRYRYHHEKFWTPIQNLKNLQKISVCFRASMKFRHLSGLSGLSSVAHGCLLFFHPENLSAPQIEPSPRVKTNMAHLYRPSRRPILICLAVFVFFF